MTFACEQSDGIRFIAQAKEPKCFLNRINKISDYFCEAVDRLKAAESKIAQYCPFDEPPVFSSSSSSDCRFKCKPKPDVIPVRMLTEVDAELMEALLELEEEVCEFNKRLVELERLEPCFESSSSSSSSSSEAPSSSSSSSFSSSSSSSSSSTSSSSSSSSARQCCFEYLRIYSPCSGLDLDPERFLYPVEHEDGYCNYTTDPPSPSSSSSSSSSSLSSSSGSSSESSSSEPSSSSSEPSSSSSSSSSGSSSSSSSGYANDYEVIFAISTWQIWKNGNVVAVRINDNSCDPRGDYQILNGPCVGTTISVY